MLINLFYGLPTMSICLLVQIAMITITLKYYSKHNHILDKHLFLPSFMMISKIMIWLTITNILQIIVWALLFQLLGEFDSFNNSIYHSAVNFATLGYGDIVMSEKHRLLGPLEAVNGVIMIGVSTAVLMGVFQDIIKKEMH